MNKTELVNAIAQKTGQSASSVGEMLSAFEDVVSHFCIPSRPCWMTDDR